MTKKKTWLCQACLGAGQSLSCPYAGMVIKPIQALWWRYCFCFLYAFWKNLYIL